VLYAILFLYGIQRVVAGLLLIACLTRMMWEQTVVEYFHILFSFHIRTVHRDIIKVFYSTTNAQVIVLKIILKFTLK
jgi:hypothetical protein